MGGRVPAAGAVPGAEVRLASGDRRLVATILVVFALVGTAAVSRADESAPATPAPTEQAAPPADFVSHQNIANQIDEARRSRKSLFDTGLRDRVLKLEERIYRRTRIRFAATYTVIYQRASRGSGPLDAAGGDFDLLGTWEAFGAKGSNAGTLNAAFEGRHRLGTEFAPSGLSTTIDSLWTTVAGFNQQDFSLIQVYWAQELLRGRLRIKVGKLSPYSSFFGNRVNSSSTMLLNYAFADNPAVFMPSNGYGLHVRYDFNECWKCVAGVQDANAVKTELDPSSLEQGEFWYAFQLQHEREIRGLGKGTYRLGLWYVDPRTEADQPSGTGTVLSIDQELGEKWLAFLRYEYQGSNLLTPDVELQALTGTESCLRVGALRFGPFRRFPDDIVGIGFAWGTPADSAAKQSFVGEVLYRFQIQDAAQLSLSLQVIESSTIYDRVLVGSLRYRVTF